MSEVLSIPGWEDAMKVEMLALKQNGTRDLAIFSPRKKAISCRWVYTVKLNPDGSLACLKACLVAKNYSEVYDINYQDTFSLVAKLTFIQILYSLAASHHWPFHQLDVKNIFLNGVLDKEVYME